MFFLTAKNHQNRNCIEFDFPTAFANSLGRQAILAHYQGKSKDDITAFLENTVLSGKDPLCEDRKRFKEQYFSCPNNKTAVENIYQDIVTSLWG